MSLEIRVLGPLEVLVDGAPLRVDTRKALAILALLAVDGRPFARDELAALCWPEADDESARGALRRTLSVLRSALHDRWLVVDRATVSLESNGDDVRIDLAALDAALADPTVATDRASLERAAAVARGPFLAGFSLRDSAEFDDWRATRASAIERRVIEVLGRLAAAAEADGEPARAVGAASRLVELDPLDEAARRRLMRLLAGAGDRAGAIRVYRQTVAVLERELGVPPLAETTAAYEAVRDGRLDPPAVTHPEIAADADVRPASLPLVGRAGALARLVDAHAAASHDGRIAIVRGEAGIGKSRLCEALVDAVTAAGGSCAPASPARMPPPASPTCRRRRSPRPAGWWCFPPASGSRTPRRWRALRRLAAASSTASRRRSARSSAHRPAHPASWSWRTRSGPTRRAGSCCCTSRGASRGAVCCSS
jgi:DNA-binding SARP family transcriptional activator